LAWPHHISHSYETICLHKLLREVKQDLITIYGHRITFQELLAVRLESILFKRWKQLMRVDIQKDSFVYSSLFGQNLKTDYFNILGMI
jgi:hypothetical protein